MIAGRVTAIVRNRMQPLCPMPSPMKAQRRETTKTDRTAHATATAAVVSASGSNPDAARGQSAAVVVMGGASASSDCSS